MAKGMSGAIFKINSPSLESTINFYKAEMIHLIFQPLKRRLICVSKLKLDEIFGIIFLSINAFLQIIYIVLFHLRNFEDKAKIVKWGYIGVDLIINIFITIRLIRILKIGTADQMTERLIVLNNAVCYWGYLQLGSTLIYNILTVICTSLKYSLLIIKISQTFNNIIFSYLVTYDKEIIRMIAGEITRAKYFNILTKNLYKKSTPISFNSIKLGDLDVEPILSNKKITFFEWGNIVGFSIAQAAIKKHANKRNVRECGMYATRRRVHSFFFYFCYICM
ncbi:hypothetical protein GLOIN_2v1778313 [Rhizophagus clarus]|uniref:Uncharacterized protein n=1 Tax=Rhizophagus clarus TaxID=94130 RepID=A0A8H3LB25_9GLOM|nr:hypothetical protein GLOIN_2v1778313 [Rhizophagus clarus]